MALQDRPTVGGLVVPYMVDEGRSPIDFKAVDKPHVENCARQGRCGVCGSKIKRGPIAFIGPDDGRTCFADPWMHPACAALSMQQCPFLSKRRDWREEEGRNNPLLATYSRGMAVVFAQNWRARITVERLAGPGGHPTMTDDTQQQPALALTAAERAEIRDEHYQLPIEGSCAGCTYGDGRGSELGWPCPTIRLLDALDASERRATAYSDEAQAISVRCDRHTIEQADLEDRLTAERDALRVRAEIFEGALKSIAKGVWIARADACLDTIGFIAREALRKAVQEARDAISDSGQSARLKG